MVCVAALLVAAWASFKALPPAGTTIQIMFAEGAGLKVGDGLRHRGIQIGTVAKIKLNEDLSMAVVSARLNPDAEAIATSGTRFWIVKPEASFKGLQGLDTLLSGQYIAVDPSRRGADVQTEFFGLPASPAISLPGDSLEIILETTQLAGVQTTAPIYFRGLQVGRVQSISLSDDSKRVQVFTAIDRQYAPLVRENTKFWNVGGVKMDMGFRGLALEAATLSSIALGGVAFNTPEPPGKIAGFGQRFELYDKAVEQWRDWDTNLGSAPGQFQKLQFLPALTLSRLDWKVASYFYMQSSQQQIGWVLPLSDGHLLGPANLFSTPKEAVEDSAQLTIDQQTRPLKNVSSDRSEAAGAVLAKVTSLPSFETTWPVKRYESAVDLKLLDASKLAICDGYERQMPLQAGDLSAGKSGIALVEAARFPQPLHGSAVVRIADSMLVGMVIANENGEGYRLVPLPALPARQRN